MLLLLMIAGCGPKQEEIGFPSGDARLAGTLYLPSQHGPHAAVVMIHGLGPDSRDNYRFYAEQFARKGIATLIYDKRGFGGSTGDWTRSPFGELADDAQAAVTFLSNRPDIKRNHISLWAAAKEQLLRLG